MLKRIIRKNRFSRLITVTVSLAILCLAISSAALTSIQASQTMERYFIDEGLQKAEAFANHGRLAILFESNDNAKEPIRSTLAYPDVIFVRLENLSGKIVAEAIKEGERLSAPTLPALPATSGPSLVSQTSHYWIFAAPVVAGAESNDPFALSETNAKTHGYAYVVISKRTLSRLVVSLVAGNILITLTIAVLMIFALRSLMRQLSQPLSNLSRLMSTAGHGGVDVRANLDGPMDIVEMSTAFNTMMDTLDERGTALRESHDEALRTAMIKSQFAAMISHEVRTPLNGIVGMLEMLRQMDLPKKATEYIQVAWESARSLTTLTNDVLDISKLEAGKLEINEIDFELHRLIEEVLSLFSKEAQSKGLQLAYSLSPAIPDRIRSDALRLRQILQNLVSNAIKFTESGSVTIKVSCKIKADDEFDLHFAVADTGIGISAASQQRLFLPYSQADKNTSKRYGGTGLGLALCRQLVMLLGGEITVDSSPGRGSTFSFTIRCLDATVGPVVSTTTTFPGKKALVVEENEVVREFLETTLSRLAISYHSESIGATALAELRAADRMQAGFDVVIINSGMTDDSGADLDRRIREESWEHAPAILLLDIHAAPFSVSAYENSIVLGKPLSQERVISALTKLLDDQRAPDATNDAEPKFLAVRGTVLVVEDNRANQMVAQAMLAKAGFECVIAKNGSAAVEQVKNGRFSLILMDCTMPIMDGYEATAHIRDYESNTGRHTPVLALTANNDSNQAKACLEAGMDDYLAKPLLLSDLIAKLQRWVPGPESFAHELPGEHEHAPSSSGEGPLDLAIFTRLRSLLTTSLGTTCRLFLEDMQGYIDRLDGAARESRAADVRVIAHAIRGSAGNIGALELMRLGKQVVEQIDLGELSQVPESIAAMRKALDGLAVTLPKEALQDHSSRPLAQTFRILIVDDDRSTRSAVRHVLQQDGFEIDEATNGLEAIAYVEKVRPDAILMDALMPQMDGFSTCARIVQIPSARDIPVVMITALEDKASIEKAFSAGACDYITKPIHFPVLSQRVRRIIRGSHAEQRVKNLVTSDALTGLPNRGSFFQKLEEDLATAKNSASPLAVYILNIDRFKSINETYGHRAGDMVLKEMALRIGTGGFDFVARLNGDEFAMIKLKAVDASEIATATQKLCATLSAPYKADSHEFNADASIGVTLFPTDASSSSALLRCADLAMQRAKKQRSGFQFYDTGLDVLVSETARVEHELRIAAQRGQLQVYYQPIVEGYSCIPVAVEALLRWEHPSRGIVLPDEFIPLAEQSGMILHIGHQVLRTVCEQIVRWRTEGLPIERASVNISRVQVLHPSFLSDFDNILQASGCLPTWIELEFAEEVFLAEPPVPVDTLTALRARGVRLCIDDFGTGSRSLEYLKSVPVTSVKIDRMFIQDLALEDDDAEDVIAEIIESAQAQRLSVVAEGVETQFQQVLLVHLGCDLLQGFRFHSPVPAEDVGRLFLNKSTETA